MSADSPLSTGPGGLSESKRRLLEQRLRGKGGTAAPPSDGIPKLAPGQPRRASPGQHWIFLSQQSVPVSPGFNITSSFDVEGDLDVDTLEHCANKVVERHEILRSNYRFQDGDLELVVHDKRLLPIERVACADAGELASESEARAEHPFDLESGPLLRLHHFSCPGGPGLLMLVIHDIIFDKWSLGVFWKETAALYREAKTGTPAALPNLPVQYSDFAAWQVGELEGGTLGQQLTYWKDRLADLPDPLPLPTDRPYPHQLTDPGRLERRHLSESTTRKLRELAAAENASLFMVCLLAFQVLLQRYTGTDDIVVGSPVANRRRKEVADLIGFFLSTVAIRSRFGDDPTVRQAIAAVRESTLGALENQDVPFDQVVEAVRPPRRPGRHPLCQVMFVFQRENEATPEFELGDVALNHVFVETSTSKFDLTLFAAESGRDMEIILEYRTDLFDQATVARMLRHYERLVDSMVADPDARISQLDLLTGEETRQLCGDWQGEVVPLDHVPDTLTLFSNRAAAAPDSPAVISSIGSLSYRELEQRSAHVAHQLAGAGVGPGDHVAHFMDRTPEAIAGLLGIMKAGAAYVPLDPDYPQERRAFVIEDAGIAAAVTSPGRSLELGDIVAVDGAGPLSETDLVGPALAVSGDSPAYLIYTSGSTGRPKGVVVTHDNLRHSTRARKHFYTNPPDRFLLIPSFAFDSSVAGIFWTLTTGGTLVLPTAEEQKDPARLCALIREHQVTDLLCVPTLYREILAQGAGALSSLKRAIVAGEACPPDLVARHHRELPVSLLYNEYGPTEASVWSVAHACSADDASDPVPIGRPIANTTAFVLDQQRRLVPTGQIGELYLGGLGVTPGYHRREDLTRERFVTWDTPGTGTTRLYRTGDLARWTPDGLLEFVGRCDDQIKLGGYRIEPGEIEAHLVQHPGIDQAVVVAVPANLGGGTSEDPDFTRLAACCVPPPGSEPPAPGELRKLLAERLPSFMVPTSYVFLDDLPLMPNGKVDRASLVERAGSAITRDTETTATTPAANAIERQVMRIWDDFFNVEQIGREDNFFDLGGHSLITPVLIERIRLDFGVSLPLGVVYEAPTVRELAERIEGAHPRESWPCLAPIRSSGSHSPLYLVHGLLGEIGHFYSLASHLPAEQPVYALQAPMEPFSEINSMAAHYVETIRDQQPHGPYRLGGYCLGGCVAYEMAQQLLASGEDVEFLVLIDTVSPIYHDDGTAPLLTRITKRARRLAAKGPSGILKSVNARARRILRIAETNRGGPTQEPGRYDGIPESFWGIADAHSHAFKHYRPRPYPRDLVLLRGETEGFEEALGWDRLVEGEIRIVQIDGPHDDVLKDPYVIVAGEKLTTLLAARNGSPS